MLIVTFLNDNTGDENIGHYDVIVRVNDRIIYSTRITGYKREKGWRNLFKCLLAEIEQENYYGN